MKQEEAFQIQRGDYFLYHGEIVKVTGRSPYNESNYIIENKNGSKFYAEVEELEPIVINEYVLKQAGAKPCKSKNGYRCGGAIILLENSSVVTGIGTEDARIFLYINHFHVLQNALRLFGEEVELKQ